MIIPVDRTAELQASLALRNGKSSDATALFVSSAVTKHPFTTLSTELLDRIRDMRSFILRCKRKYGDFSSRGMSDGERDELDSAVAHFLREAMAQIELLKTEAVKELARLQDSASFPAHKLGVVAILNGELQSVSRLSEELRGLRIRHAIAAKPRAEITYDPALAREVAEDIRRRDPIRDHRVLDNADVELLEQQFAEENASLVTELVETRERVQEAERAVVEIASLNHVFATKVLEQAKEIETLYDLAIEATNHVDRGNKELRKMRQRGPVLKYWTALFVCFLTIGILFVDWISTRRSIFF